MNEDAVDMVRQRIRSVLTIYPKLSRSMLQIGIGTSLAPVIWSPVLDDMVEKGEIVIDHIVAFSATGRNQTYHIIQLVDTGSSSSTPASQPKQIVNDPVSGNIPTQSI